MAKNTVRIAYTGDARSLQRASTQAEGSLTGLSKRGSHALERLGKAGILAGAALATGVAFGLEKSIKAAMDAQVSQARLAQAFKTAGQSAGTYAGLIDKAEARSRKLGFAGNETREALGSLEVATHDAGKATKDLAIAEDLARFKHVQLADATKMITSASAGNARAIKQLGILLVPLTDHVDALKNANVKATTAAGRLEYAHAKLQDKMETAAHAVDLVRQKVEGQGEAFAKTAAGSMQVFHEELQHIEVLIGTAVLPIMTKLIEKVSTWMERLSRSKAFHEDLRKGLEIVKTAFHDLQGPVETTIRGLGRLGHGIATLRSALGPDIFSGLIIGIVGSVGVLSAFAKLNTAFKAMALAAGGTGPLGLAFLSLTITIGGLAALFIHNRNAAQSVSDAYKRGAAAAEDLKNAEESLKRSELNVAQAHLRQKEAVDQVYNAQRAYNAAVREFGAGSHPALEALHNLQQAKLDLRQADIDATAAVKENTKSEQAHARAHRNTTDTIIEEADKQRHYQSTLGAVKGALGGVTFGLSKQGTGYQDAGEKADIFANKLDKIAAHTRKLNPALAAADDAVAALARSIRSIPSDLTIRFIVKTLEFTPGSSPKGGPFQGGGHAAGGRIRGGSGRADDVAAWLTQDEFVVTPGGESMLETMTFPGVLNWLEPRQPRAFAGGGRATRTIEYDRLYKPPVAPGGGGRGTSGANVNLGRQMAAGRGWTGGEFSALNWLWTKESGWNQFARNPSSGAYGIPQALPPTKMPFAAQAGGGSSPAAQIGWGLGYISGRYGSPSGAWAHEQAFNWYAKGGRVKKPKHVAPHLPDAIREAEARAAGTPGLVDDIVAVTREEHWIDSELHRKDLTPSERGSMKVRKIRVENRLKSLRTRQAKRRQRGQRDYTKLPARIEYAIARARNMHDDAALRLALIDAATWLRAQLGKHGLSLAQRTAILDALTPIEDEIAQLYYDAHQPPEPGDTGGGTDNSADLQAQLEQANARLGVAQNTARLDEAFIASGGVGGGISPYGSNAGGGQAPVIVFQHLVPDAQQIRRATEAIAMGAGMQPYRTSSVERTGY